MRAKNMIRLECGLLAAATKQVPREIHGWTDLGQIMLDTNKCIFGWIQ